MHIAQSKHPSVVEQHTRMRAAEMAVVNAAAANGWRVPESRREPLRERVEELSGGRNTVLYSPEGCPGIYVRIDADTTLLSGTIATETNGSQLHPAFVLGSGRRTHYFAGKYPGAVVDHATGLEVQGPAGTNANRRMVSLPGIEPVADIDFDVSSTTARQNGTGFHLLTNAEWAWMCLQTLQWGWEPRGANGNNGRDYLRSDESSLRLSNPAHGRSATGTGPVSWTHDGTPYGVWDLNGSQWEWVGGLRTVDGEIQVVANNDAALHTTNMSAGSAAWRAISAATGALVDPGSVGTLKWDASGVNGTGNVILSDEVLNPGDGSVSAQTQFRDLPVKAGLVVPNIVRALALHPLSNPRPVRGRLFARNQGERLAHRGGHWNISSNAGVAALSLNFSRSVCVSSLGARPAFVV